MASINFKFSEEHASILYIKSTEERNGSAIIGMQILGSLYLKELCLNERCYINQTRKARKKWNQYL
ncbi:hypothetical protein DYD83_02825 [Dickeya fangzhongdai]|uniref:Uncharacterized protein n=1 Tax=Dickeya fangzhongdai TaxID=1778540 RepID=A0A2K8QIT4_9GAMM|nr:hypothetical protein CVE23_02785 [Dickeya fangzhongdai]QOH46426.1 hypothetical protein DYD82_02820 [Dickeya fangzhongdai]QOH50733.1 hypothetical protein DYD83_02825 [Dickeya fangzhongdai]